MFVALSTKPLREWSVSGERKGPGGRARSFLAWRILLKGISDVRLRSPWIINMGIYKGN